MDVQAIIDDIDRKFAQMRRVRELFVSIMEDDRPTVKRSGRPKGSTNKTTETSASSRNKPAKRTMTAESKARIAAAQKARWAAQKKAEEPATRKYAAKLKPAKKSAPAKKTVAPVLKAATDNARRLAGRFRAP